MLSFIFILVLATNAQIAHKNAADNRLVKLGVIGPTLAEISSFTTCIQPQFYNEVPPAGLMTPAMSCGTSAVGVFTIAMWGAQVTSIGTCLSNQGSSLTQFMATCVAVLEPEMLPFYNIVMNNFTVAKNSGMSEDDVLDIGYSAILQKFKRPYVNKLCIAVAKAVNNTAQFACGVNGIASIVDFTTYPCDLWAKSNLLGAYNK